MFIFVTFAWSKQWTRDFFGFISQAEGDGCLIKNIFRSE